MHLWCCTIGSVTRRRFHHFGDREYLRSAGLQPADLLLILLFLPHYYCYYYYSSHINFQKRLQGLESWNLHRMYKMWIVKMIFRIGLIPLPVPEICAEMTSKSALNTNISITAHHIDAQFVAVGTESNSAHFVWRHLFQKDFRYALMTSLKFSKFNFSAAIRNIYAQFAHVNRGLKFCIFHAWTTFSKVLPVCANGFIEVFSAAISNIYAQLVPVNRGLNSAYFMPQKLFESTSGMREWRHWNFQSLISQLLYAIFIRNLRQWIEDFILDISCFSKVHCTSGMREWCH